jgi:hypothetical protein
MSLCGDQYMPIGRDLAVAAAPLFFAAWPIYRIEENYFNSRSKELLYLNIYEQAIQ